MYDENKQEGFDAIYEALSKLYPKQEGIYYGVAVPYFMGGNDPLDGVEVWKSEKGMPHWHYVTYGFTELYEKESDDDKISGYGFELTFRLRRGKEENPPSWPVSLLQNLARYVFSTGNVFGVGHHINCNGPIALGTDTKLTALGFRRDTELGEMDTPNGHMEFLQAVGITSDEMDAVMTWDGASFMAELERFVPLCITNLSRTCQMKNPEFYEVWQEGTRRDGSSTSTLYLTDMGAKLKNERAQLRFGAGHAGVIINMLRARVGKDRELWLQGKDTVILFEPGERSAVSYKKDMLTVVLTKEALEEICTSIKPHKGIYAMSKAPVTIELIPTKITDKAGKVTEIIE